MKGEPMKCKNCGNKIDRKDLYCSYCGTKILDGKRKNKSIKALLVVISMTFLLILIVFSIYILSNKEALPKRMTDKENNFALTTENVEISTQNPTDLTESEEETTTQDEIETKVEDVDERKEYYAYIDELVSGSVSALDGVKVSNGDTDVIYRFYAIEDFDSDGTDELFICSESGGMLSFIFYKYDESNGIVTPMNGLKNVRDWKGQYDPMPLCFYSSGTVSYIDFLFSLDPEYFTSIGLIDYLPDKNVSNYQYCGYGLNGDNDIGMEIYILRNDIPEYIGSFDYEECREHIKDTIDEQIDVELHYFNEKDLVDETSFVDYSSILDDYYTVLKSVYYDDYSLVDSFFEKYDIYGDGFYENSIFDYSYAYRDLNGDGQDELFVSDGFTITSVYTIKDEKIINLINGWSRKNIQLCSDNILYSSGSGGASISIYSAYEMNDSSDGMYVKGSYMFDATEYTSENNSSDAYQDDDFWFYTTDEDNYPENSNTTYLEAKAFIDERSQKVISLDYLSFFTYKDEIIVDSFYGIWCYGSKDEKEAQDFANNFDISYMHPQIFITTDWDNLNKEFFYVVTAGVYKTEEDAESYIDEVHLYYPDAYIKHSGNYTGGK